MQTFNSISDAQLFYEKWGFDTVPLRDGEKTPISRNWQKRDPDDMWARVPLDVNIGIRCGGRIGVAVLDCDEKTTPGTFENAKNWLGGLGFGPGRYPVVSTASGVGRHIYLRTNEHLDGNYRLLARDFGAGEFRYGPGSMVVAPPSDIGQTPYQLISGDFRDLPLIEMVEVANILKSGSGVVRRQQHISRYAWELLRGKGLEKYKSRSEAEYAILVLLINSGHNFESALSLFLENPCAGKFRELNNKNPSDAIRWLALSFNEAKEWATTHESLTRQEIRALMDTAQSRAWPGRTGSYDRAVYLAHLEIAFEASRDTYAASSRGLAEIAGITYMTASKASKRLIKQGLISLENPGTRELAAVYSLNKNALTYTLPSIPCVGKCKSKRAHDAFRRQGLGKAASEVWETLLRKGPMAAKQLAQYTGRHVGTIRRALKKMSSLVDQYTGEYFMLVQKGDKGLWMALNVDLDQAARLLGTAGAGERQRQEHAMQRRVRARRLRALQQHRPSHSLRS